MNLDKQDKYKEMDYVLLMLVTIVLATFILYLGLIWLILGFMDNMIR